MAGILQFQAWVETRAHDARSKYALAMIAEWRKTLSPPRKPRPRSSQSVSSEVKREMRRLHKLRMPQHAIAQALNVNQGRVNEVLNGKR